MNIQEAFAHYISELHTKNVAHDVIVRAERAVDVIPRLMMAAQNSRVLARVTATNGGYYCINQIMQEYGCSCPDEAPRSSNGSKLCKHVLAYRMVKRWEREGGDVTSHFFSQVEVNA